MSRWLSNTASISSYVQEGDRLSQFSLLSGPCCLPQEVRPERRAWTGSWKTGIGTGSARTTLPVFDMWKFPWFFKSLKQDPCPPPHPGLFLLLISTARTSKHIKAAEKVLLATDDPRSRAQESGNLEAALQICFQTAGLGVWKI